jgi:PhzF family phenazine biosynthesis protein
MDIPVYQVDAFTDRAFGGNPAAICPLDSWLDDALMQAVAGENNLSETAFLVPEGDAFRLRWFTPTVEVDLCGHATLASAWVVFERLQPGRADPVAFETRSGRLTVARRDDGMLEMDFPAIPAAPCEIPAALADGLGAEIGECLVAANHMAVLADEAAVRALAPDMAALASLHPRGVIATAPGEDCDFVSRFFGPSFGVQEDPATGSAHCMLTPYWSARLGKAALNARQVSARGGVLSCAAAGEWVRIAGRAVLTLSGHIHLPG